MFEDRKRVDTYVDRIKKGESSKNIKEDLIKNEGVDAEDADKVVKGLVSKASERIHVFWEKSEKGKIDVDPYMFSKYLSDEGFFMFIPKGSENYVFIQRKGNLVHNTNEDKIKKHVLNGYLRGLDDKSVYNFFARKTSLFKYDFLNQIEEKKMETVMDTPDKAHLFYKNGVVVVTKKIVTGKQRQK